jgi:hypothetical protein
VRNFYKIIPEDKIIIETYFGDFSLLSFIKLKWKEMQDSNFRSDFDYILDFQNVTFPNNQKYQDILNFLELYIDMIAINKCAIVTQNPNQVVQSVLFVLEAEKVLPVSFKVFSGLIPAYKWINKDYVDISMFPKNMNNE